MQSITFQNRHSIVILIAFLLCFWSIDMLAAQDDLTNTYCPVTTDEKVDQNFWLDYQGRRIYFCCRKCKAEFASNPDPYLANLTQPPQPGESADTTGSHHDETASHHDQSSEHASGAASVSSAKGEAQGAHSHESHTHEKPKSITERTAQYAGRFHPVVVHFPIALVLVALLAEVMAMLTKNGFYRHASEFSIAAGAIGAVVAAGLGWLAGEFASYSGELASTLSWHRWLGISTATVTVIAALLVWGAVRKDSKPLRNAYRLALVAAAGLVGITGHLGATLIYGLNYFGL